MYIPILSVICMHIICMCILFIQYFIYHIIVYYLSYTYAALYAPTGCDQIPSLPLPL